MVESGLDWGARYGDIMHFDMRTTPGVGSKIEKAKNDYISAMHTKARKLYTQVNNEDFFFLGEIKNILGPIEGKTQRFRNKLGLWFLIDEEFLVI